MRGLLELKDFTGSVKDVDFKNRIVTGYFNNFDSIDHDKDIIRKGAGVKSIQERMNDIYFLNHHDWKQPHGFASIIKETDEGTYFESNPLPDTTFSNDALVLYQNGIIKEHSFGFVTLKSNSITLDNQKVREITEYKLYEFSNVTLGANPNTPFAGFKSRFDNVEDINEEVKKLLNVFRNERITDDLGVKLELSIKMLQLEAFNLGKQHSMKQAKPSADTSLNYEPLINTIKNFKL